MELMREKYLVATALFEYINNEQGKPFELQRHNDVEEMQQLLDRDYAAFLETLQSRKSVGHQNLTGTIGLVQEDD